MKKAAPATSQQPIFIINNKNITVPVMKKAPAAPTPTVSPLNTSQNGLEKTTKNKNKLFVGGLTNLCPGNLEEVMTNHFAQYGMLIKSILPLNYAQY